MARQPLRGMKPKKSNLGSLPVPTAGWISNRNLAIPNGQEGPGAQIMDNWFPTASSARLRRGQVGYATMPNNLPVKSMFSYVSGTQRQLFAATDAGIWDVTVIQEADSQILIENEDAYLSPDALNEAFGWYSVDPLEILWPTTNGEWITIQFATAGGTFLVGVNGVDEGFIYDGQDFADLAITFPDGVTLTSADFSYVWAYKQRIYFVQKDSLDVWYLPVDSIGGEVAWLPLGGVFNRGGNLLWGHTWSLASGGDGGLSEQNVFVTTEGEVAIYQGLSPDSAADWSKVGVYRIGTPMGKRGFVRAGGDLVIATTIGMIPLSKAIDMDYAALGIAAISSKIADEWRDAIATRGSEDWVCELWGEGSMMVVSPPNPPNTQPVVFVANSDTGAWCRFTNWNPSAMEVFQGRLYLGTPTGRILIGWAGGNDDGLPYTGVLVPLYNDVGSPGQRKIAKIARAVKRSRYRAREQVHATFDWSNSLPPAPDVVTVPIGNEWGNAIWGQSIWGAEQSAIVTEEWRSVGGSGYAMSVVLQITSGMPVPLDVELVRLDISYELADIIS